MRITPWREDDITLQWRREEASLSLDPRLAWPDSHLWAGLLPRQPGHQVSHTGPLQINYQGWGEGGHRA